MTAAMQAGHWAECRAAQEPWWQACRARWPLPSSPEQRDTCRLVLTGADRGIKIKTQP